MKKLYKVEIYQILGETYTFQSHTCDIWPIGKAIVSISNKKRNPHRNNVGECIEISEGFSIPLIDSTISSYFDAEENEHQLTLSIPYKYDYWDKYSLYIICAEDINERHIATSEDLAEYNPQKEVWYKVLKEIQEKGINFDYQQEFMEETYGESSDSSNQSVLKKKR